MFVYLSYKLFIMFFAYGPPAFVITMFVIYKLMSDKITMNFIDVLGTLIGYAVGVALFIGFCVLIYLKFSVTFPYFISSLLLTLLWLIYTTFNIKIKDEIKSLGAVILIVLNTYCCYKVISFFNVPKKDYILVLFSSLLVGIIYTLSITIIILKTIIYFLKTKYKF